FSATMFGLTTHPPIDATVAVITALLCGLAALGFSLGPALRATRINLADDLKQQAGGPAGAGRWKRFFSLRHRLVLGQIALSLVPVLAGGLCVRGARQQGARDQGFGPDGQFVFTLDYSLGSTPVAEAEPRQRSLLHRIRELPGVAHAAIASAVPYNFDRNMR